MRRGEIFREIEQETSTKSDNEEIQSKEEASTKDEEEADIDAVLLIPVFRNSLVKVSLLWKLSVVNSMDSECWLIPYFPY